MHKLLLAILLSVVFFLPNSEVYAQGLGEECKPVLSCPQSTTSTAGGYTGAVSVSYDADKKKCIITASAMGKTSTTEIDQQQMITKDSCGEDACPNSLNVSRCICVAKTDISCATATTTSTTTLPGGAGTVTTTGPAGAVVTPGRGPRATPCTGPNCSTGTGHKCTLGSNSITTNGTGIMTAIGCVPTEPKALVEEVLKYGTIASGAIAFLLMLLGGLGLITAEGNPEAIKHSQERFYSAIIGLLFIIFAVLLMQVIGVDILSLPGFGKN